MLKTNSDTNRAIATNVPSPSTPQKVTKITTTKETVTEEEIEANRGAIKTDDSDSDCDEDSNYDSDEEEWLEDDAIPAAQLHDEGRLAACFAPDDETKAYVFYQNPSQDLVFLDSEWSQSVLPAKPLVGGGLFAVVLDEYLHVFYVASEDHLMHYLVRESDGAWVDNVLAKHKIEGTLTRFMVNVGEKGLEAYALADSKAILQIRGGDEGSVEELGKVDEQGVFVPGTSAECCRYIVSWWTSVTVTIVRSYHYSYRRICY